MVIVEVQVTSHYGMFSSNANCSQFLLDMKILPTHRQCRGCNNPMAIGSCSTTKYREGCCWKCPCGQTTSLRVNSVLENKNISYDKFAIGFLSRVYRYLGSVFWRQLYRPRSTTSKRIGNNCTTSLLHCSTFKRR